MINERRIQNTFNHVFGETIGSTLIGSYYPPHHPWDNKLILPNVTEEVTDGVHTFCFEVPGFKKTELKIEVVGSNLVVSGERTVGANKKTIRLVHTLNANYDLSSVAAKLEDGILSVSYGLKDSHEIVIT